MYSKLQLTVSYITNALLLAGAFTALTAPVHAQQIHRELTKIMALGDSITEGFDSSGPGTRSYRFDLTGALNSTTCNYEMVGSRSSNYMPTGFSSPHDGYSGHGVEHFLNAQDINPGIDAIIGNAQPDLVLIHLGSNDMNRDQTIASTKSELIDLINRIWAVKSDVSIYIANVIPWYGSSTNNRNPNITQDVALLGNAIRLIVNDIDSDQLHYVNVKNGYVPSYMQPDQVHPNIDGEAHIADAFFTAII